MEKENFNGFKNKFRLAEITAKIEDVIESKLSITDLDSFNVTFDDKQNIIYVCLNFSNYHIHIELWADYNVEVNIYDNHTINWDIVDIIAELREMLMNCEFDEYFEEN